MNKVLFIMTLVATSMQCSVYAQQSGSCELCKMDINDTRFLAKADMKSGAVYSFDATECLVNYLKKNKLNSDKIWVTDYTTRKLIPAENAFYLKSKAIPSPMGASISAYETETSVRQMKKKKGGDILTWTALVERFKDSNFGSLEDAHSHHAGRPDMYGPTGVSGDHLHRKGGKMLSAKYMNMQMEGNLQGTKSIMDQEVFDKYMVSPQNMTMQMMMIGAMYAPSDRITLMAMQNFTSNQMDLTAMMMMGGMKMKKDFETSSMGLGDLTVSGLIGVVSRLNSSVHLNTGVSIPLGEINNRDNTPMQEDTKLPYAMQLGSGTYDATIGATYRGSANNISWGVQQLNVLRIGQNKYDYTMGNVYQANIWGAYAINKHISSSVRANATQYGSIVGADVDLMPMMVPTANGLNYERKLIRSFWGINALLLNEAILLSAEIGAPIYQNNKGVFMNENLTLNTGIKLIL